MTHLARADHQVRRLLLRRQAETVRGELKRWASSTEAATDCRPPGSCPDQSIQARLWIVSGPASAYPAVSAGDFENAQLLKPPARLPNQFHAIAADMMNLRHCLHLRNLNLRQTRDLLLPQLISGEIIVDRCEIDAVAQGV